jgi:hypothetical protein
MYDLSPRTVSSLLVVLLVMLLPNGFAVQGGALGPIVIDGPWDNLPPGAGPGLALDSEWGALTLKPDLTKYAFVLSPDPAKELSANVVETLGVYDGRVYLGYGDLGLNLGPLDILAYDPLTGELIREMADVPEEEFALWHVSTTGRFYVAGADARESWTFGNFFINDGLGWQKRRTIQDGVHVFEVVECRGRLFAHASCPAPSPVGYPYILVSDNYGASWSYECIDPAPIDLSLPPYTSVVHDIEAVTHRTPGRSIREDEYFYAIVRFRKPAGEEVQRLYRFDGRSWVHVRIDTPNGEFRPSSIAAIFKNQIIVFGSAGRQMTYAIDHQTQKEIPFLTASRTNLGPVHVPPTWKCRGVCDGWLYWIVRDSADDKGGLPPPAYLLCRTQDLQTWETLGTVTLPPGARPLSLGFAHGRIYVGAAGIFRGPDPGELSASRIYPVHNSSLQWDAEVPDGSQVTFKVRTVSTAASGSPRLLLNSLPWVGPDGTEATAFTASGQVLHPQHDGDDVLQVIVLKTPNNDGQYPHVRSVTLNSPGGSVTLAVDEGSGLYTAVTSTDSNGAEYLSEVFALAEPIARGSLFFDCATPGQTSLRFQVRSASAEDLLAGKSFVGPDGSPNTFYESSPEPLWSGHSGDMYIQYRAVLASSKPTVAPFLRKVTLLTRTDAPGHFDIQVNGPSAWVAGQANSMQVAAKFPDGTLIPIRGNVSLSGVAEDSAQDVQVQPNEVTLVDGVGVLDVLLQRAVRTRICAELAGMRGCSQVVDVLPGEPFAISVTSNLTEPLPNWSPVGQAGQPFTLSLKILDRYRNTVTGYAGTVRCERWRSRSEGQLLGPYQFQPTDQGCHEFSGVVIDEPGEWNLVCSDEITPQVAGTLTVNIQ